MEAWQLTPWHELDLVIRLIMASGIGALIGYERERAEKPAGFRTLLLVCLGATLFTIASGHGFGPLSDPARVAAGIVIGIGFLGAGTIIRGEHIVGLTTAAAIWTVAAIGLAIGAGLYLVAWVATGIVLFVLRFPGLRRHRS
ncbi:MAG: MgtC/SapB family protein [Dehalococcoidia bacterium]|nr:MAG: MgtC/SapB family protein [Dehalococcoidia bacterium]